MRGTLDTVPVLRGFLRSLLLLPLAASLAFSQQPRQDENSTQWSPATLAGEFLEHDFVNWFAFADGVFDTYAPISTPTGIVNNGSFGWEIGGGATVNHRFRDGNFSLSYRGGFRDYQSASYSTGTDQSLGISYSKRFARRWTLSTSIGAGISLYGSSVFLPAQADSTAAVIVPNNPFATQTKYLAPGASISYQQSRRLSYVGSVSYFLQRYNYSGSLGSEGVTGSGSVYYRVTARTTVGGTYAHSYYVFQRGAGNSSSDTVQASISHQFPNHWNASFSGGITRSNVTGFVILPASFFNPNLGPGLYVPGLYHQSTSFPSFSGSVGRSFHHSSFFASGGQGLSPGNGYYLASKSLNLNGVYSIAIQRRQNVSFSGGYYRLSSVSNSVAVNYNSSSLTASYGISLIRYFGLNARYDFVHYGSLSPNPSLNDSRLSFGVNFSSKSIPLTLF